MKYERVLMLEDDPVQGWTIFDFLNKKFGGQVQWLRTESDFHRCLGDIRSGVHDVPDLVISDMMMPWASPGENTDIPIPEEVREESFRRAGARCRKYFRSAGSLTATVPWLYFSVLRGDDVGFQESADEPTFFVTKEEGLGRLLEVIHSMGESDWQESGQEVTDLLLSDEKSRACLLSALSENWRHGVVWKPVTK